MLCTMDVTASATAGPAHARAQSVTDARHPAARRVADVLRSRSAKPRVFVLDDLENIEQAIANGIALDSVYISAAVLEHEAPALVGVGEDVPVYALDNSVVRELFGDQKSARVFALARAPRPSTLVDLLSAEGDVVVLDGVRIVGNIGAITRTARALGAAGLILVDSGLRTIVDRRLVRASRGLVFSMPIVLASRDECVDFVRRERLKVVALSADAAEPLSGIRNLDERIALVLGSERDGVSAELDSVSTHRYAISMTADVESLNVSVTAGIALYEHMSRP